MAGKVKDLTDSTFQDAVSTGVSLVDFWAPWCGPCRMQGPIVEKVAETLDGKAMVAKVNVDEHGEAASKFNVSSIPTLVVMKDGKEVKRFIGVQQENDLTDAIEAFLK